MKGSNSPLVCFREPRETAKRLCSVSHVLRMSYQSPPSPGLKINLARYQQNRYSNNWYRKGPHQTEHTPARVQLEQLDGDMAADTWKALRQDVSPDQPSSSVRMLVVSPAPAVQDKCHSGLAYCCCNPRLLHLTTDQLRDKRACFSGLRTGEMAP